MRESSFREDLWYRIAVFPILLPPLRDRPGDIPALAIHFAQRAAIRFGFAPVVPTVADFELLQTYDWPGNIRELGAVIDRAAILGDGGSLELAAALGVAPPVTLRASAAMPNSSLSAFGPRRNKIVTLDEAMRTHRSRSASNSGPCRRWPRRSQAPRDQPAHASRVCGS